MQGVDEYHDDGDPRPYIGAPDLFVGRGGQVSGTLSNTYPRYGIGSKNTIHIFVLRTYIVNS